MQELVVVRERQRALNSDIMDLQASVRSQFDKLIASAVGPGSYYTGFQTDDTGQWEVTLLKGDLYLAGQSYRKDVSTVLSQEIYNVRPVAQKRYVAIIGYGLEVDTTPTGASAEPRQFIVNTTTRETEVQQVSTRRVRSVRIDIIAGIEQAQPSVPAIGAGNVLIATVLLGTGGIEAIAMNPDAVLPQTERNAIAIATIAQFLDVQALRIDTLVNDLAATKAQLDTFATRDQLLYVQGVANEALATAKRALYLAENLDVGAQYLRDFEDNFVDLGHTLTSGAGYSAKVSNGLGFPGGSSNSLTNGIETFNAVEPKVAINNDLMLPAFTNNLRIDTFGQGKVARQAALQSFTSGTHAVTTTKPVTSKIVYETRKASYKYTVSAPSGSATFGGVLVNSFTLVTIPLSASVKASAKSQFAGVLNGSMSMFPDFDITSVKARIVAGAGTSSKLEVTVAYTYTKQSTEQVGGSTTTVDVATTVDGQGRAETWLQERDGWLTQVGLFFTQKGASGDVRLLISEVDASGAPNLNATPVSVTVPFANILAAPMTTVSPAGIETVVKTPPALCRGGRRYALDVLSQGAHFVRMTEGVSAITQGEHWALTDANKWQQPALETKQNMAFRLYFARFASTRIEVDLKPLSLAGGIQDVSVTAQMVVPALTDLDFEVQPSGSAYQVLGASDGQRLEADFSGNPELVPFRVVFQGTLDIMPALSRGSAKSTVTASRAALALTHWSEVVDVGAGNTANLVRVLHRLRNFDDAPHNFAVTLVTDPLGTPTNEVADAVSDVTLPDGTISRTSVFQIPVGKRTFQFKTTGSATAISNLFSVDQVYATFFDA